METLSLSLFFSLFLVAVNVHSKDTLPIRRSQKLKEIVTVWSQPAFPTTCLLSFPFSFDVTSHKSYDSLVLSFSLSFFFAIIFSFFEDNIKKRQRPHLPFFLSFFLFHFLFHFLSLKITTKTADISLFFLSFFFTIFHSLKITSKTADISPYVSFFLSFVLLFRSYFFNLFFLSLKIS